MKHQFEHPDEVIKDLTGLGYSMVDRGDFHEALRFSAQLEKMGIHTSFEIAAAAYMGLGKPESAVLTLERGVERFPQYWINWELLGSCRSETGDYTGAEEAYLSALDCNGAWLDSIHFNRAVAAARSGKHAEALDLLEEVLDPALDEPIAMLRIGLLVDLDRTQEALAVCDECLNRVWGSDDEEDIQMRFRAKKALLLYHLERLKD